MKQNKTSLVITLASLLLASEFPWTLSAEDSVDLSPPLKTAATTKSPRIAPTHNQAKSEPAATVSSAETKPAAEAKPGTAGEPRTEDTMKAVAAPSAVQPKSEANPDLSSLTPELIDLRENIRNCLGYYFQQCDSVAEHSPWGIMHNLIAYGVDTQVFANGKKANAIGYLCWNGNCRGQQLFYLNRGRIEARLGPGVQGHAGQFLAMMAQSRVKPDYPMQVDGRDLKLADMIKYEMRSCEAGTELTFKLIALSHYLDTDAKWKNDADEDWSIPRLIKEELAQPIIGAACGGTHRLMGFNYAAKKREKEGKPMTGQWKRARLFLDDYFDYTFYLQNDDGSFSTDHFRGRNSHGDINLRLETSGHILEWFVASLSNEQLRDPRVTKGVSYLTKLLLENRRNEWEIGPKGHALHALAIYSERMYSDKPGGRDSILARGRKLYREEQMIR